MLYLFGCLYVLFGIGSAIFYIRDMKQGNYKPMIHWIIIALFFPPVFWLFRSLVGAFLKL